MSIPRPTRAECEALIARLEQYQQDDWPLEVIEGLLNDLSIKIPIFARAYIEQWDENEALAKALAQLLSYREHRPPEKALDVAHLIAAAPELLAVAREVHRIHVCCCSPRDTDLCIRCEAEAAIAKAEGMDPETAPVSSPNTPVEAKASARTNQAVEEETK